MVHGSIAKQTSGLVLNTRIQRGARNQEGLQSALFETQIATSKLLLQGYAKVRATYGNNLNCCKSF